VVEQAGGAVIQLTGEPISYADPSAVLNPYFLVHGKSSVDWADLASGSIQQPASARTIA
jgi:3'(2'), 5'-bisphosphate nucleotidase